MRQKHFTAPRRDSGKFTIIELLCVTFLIGGPALVFMAGSDHFGSWGGLLGLLLGIGVGLLVVCVITYAVNAMIRAKQLPTNKPPEDQT